MLLEPEKTFWHMLSPSNWDIIIRIEGHNTEQHGQHYPFDQKYRNKSI